MHEGRRQTGRQSAYAGSRLKLNDEPGRSRLTRQPSSRTGENPQSGMLGGIEERSSRQGRSLAGCKSPYRQLPVVGRLAYPMRGEVTNRVLLGRKSPGCPAGVFAAVGTIWGASKLGGRNITKYLRPRKAVLREVVIRGIGAGSRPTFPWGRPMTPWKKQVQAHGVPPGHGIQHPRKGSQNNVGKLPWAAVDW